ncbi:MAG: 50S ribosomal protein L13 [Desulfobacterales bacterium]|nr:50S ribosomal protein L13 [Desulfobacterales bacterium]MBF0396393.1 50S ribosomal protein L13 [Desulfobacterales bacterium]
MKKYTYSAKKGDYKAKWYIIDANGLVLGRLSSMVASRLKGKCNPLYTPHSDMGDFIVIVNADKILLTGKKTEQKCYYHHSGYPGGLKTTIAKDLMKKKPEDLIRIAVKGMLPKNSLGRDMGRKLKVYAGEKHPHAAQQPEMLKL